ncbi:MAG TPA: Spy/CpxP family protein refolding chaperone [Vineibacter sp.]|nr:Spy/CpxP family protein refolding chaperone [Vineibacter sp.]
MSSRTSITAVVAMAAFSGMVTAAVASHDEHQPAHLLVAQHDMKSTGDKGMKGSGMKDQGMHGPGMQGSGMQPPGGHSPDAKGPAAQGRGGMSAMADQPTDRIEGRIAFLHAEIRVTETQMAVWTEFANVLRANAKRIADADKAHPPLSAASAAERLEAQERWLAARLENVRALRAAYGKLFAVLDENQKKTANELVASHMGMR